MTAATLVTRAITTPIATAAATVTAKVPSAAAAAIFAWLGFIDFQSAAADLLAIELVNSCRSFGVGRHLDKCESARAASIAVFDHAC